MPTPFCALHPAHAAIDPGGRASAKAIPCQPTPGAGWSAGHRLRQRDFARARARARDLPLETCQCGEALLSSNCGVCNVPTNSPPPPEVAGGASLSIAHVEQREMRMKAMAVRLALALAGTALGTALLGGLASAQDTIKIGVTQPLTGAFAASGNYVAQGAKLAEEEINAAGGVLNRKIQLIVEDNKSNPTEAVATAEKLTQKDKVPVMMGAWSSTLTLAVMPKLMEYEVPMLVETSSSSKITTSGNPWIFRISPTSEMEAKAFAPMVKSLGIRKADLLSTNNDFGLGAAKEFAETAQKAGVEIGARETMDPKAVDFSAQLAKIKASGGDTLFDTTAVEQ